MSDRCQHSGPEGQCRGNRVDGSEFCEKHSNEADRIRGYRLSDPALRARFDRHSASAALETVREEVVLLKSLIEERLELAKTPADKINAFSVVHPAISTLNKLVESLTKLERQTHTVLGKDALMVLGDKIVDILIEELMAVEGSGEIIDRVAPRIAKAITEARNPEE